MLIESVVEAVAAHLGLAASAVREKNLYRPVRYKIVAPNSQSEASI